MEEITEAHKFRFDQDSVAMGLTQALTEMSTRNLPGGKGWLERKADNLTAICELIG
jgi:hypothetical protein